MAFNSANFASHRAYRQSGEAHVYHVYSHPTDLLDDIDSGSYFPPDLIRAGEFLICTAADGYRIGWAVSASGVIQWGESL